MSEHGKSPIAHKNGTESKRDKLQKEAKKAKIKSNKTNGAEIVEKQEVVQKKVYDPSDLFLSSLARKCNSFFDWISNTNSDSFPQLLWKNQMISLASQMYPELNNSQLARLVDRDWKYMPEQQRNKICESYSKMPAINDLEEVINNCDPRLLY